MITIALYVTGGWSLLMLLAIGINFLTSNRGKKDNVSIGSRLKAKSRK